MASRLKSLENIAARVPGIGKHDNAQLDDIAEKMAESLDPKKGSAKAATVKAKAAVAKPEVKKAAKVIGPLRSIFVRAR